MHWNFETHPCVPNSTFGWASCEPGREALWVSGGCKAEFVCISGPQCRVGCGTGVASSGRIECSVHRAAFDLRSANSSWCTHWPQRRDGALHQQRSTECATNLSRAGLVDVSDGRNVSDDDAASGRRTGRAGAISATPLRAAVCLTGHVRTFSRPHVFESIRTNLLDALSASVVDVFAVLALRDAGMKMQRGWNHMPTDVLSYADLAAPLARVRARAVAFETAVGEVHLNRNCTLNSRNTPPSYVTRLADQWRKMERCFGLVERAEQSDGVPYDVIVRSRPDLLWLRPHPPLQRDTAMADFRFPMMEWHATLPRANASLIFSLFSRYSACRGAERPFDAPRFTAEEVWQRALEPTKPSLVGLPFVIVRDSREDARQSFTRQVTARPMCDDRRDARIFGLSCGEVFRRAYPDRNYIERSGESEMN
mmetsp:Transcript_48763/g.144078  ORF Transcript_48763/g.144078 Transcript_48763/m.144078 type:complete len:424 (+) Transcript_48763:470-1741(+)